MSFALSNLPISRKLLLGTIVFILPISVLVVFMDISFVYDLSIARQEMIGNRYLRTMAPLLMATSLHRADMLEARMSGVSNPPDTQELDRLFHSIMRELDALPHEDKEELYLDRESLLELDMEMLSPEAILDDWSAMDMGDAASLSAMGNRLINLFIHVGEHSQLILDPAMDSHRLADILGRAIPQFLVQMDRTLPLGEALGQDGSPAYLRQNATLLKEMAHFAILSDLKLALMSDGRYYGVSPSLARNLPPVMDAFDSSLAGFVHALEGRPMRTPETRAELFRAWRETIHATERLLTTTSVELDILLQKRINSYSLWRTMGYLLGITSLLIALFAAFTLSRSITGPVTALVEYSRAVSAGEYGAEPQGQFGPELETLSTTMTSMVDQLRMRVALTQGILDSIVAPFLVTDREARITYINMAMTQLMAYDGDNESFLGMRLFDFFRENGRIRELEQQCLQERVCMENVEARISNAMGSERIVAAYFSPLYNHDLEITGMSCFLFDLTELREKEREIREQSVEIEQLAAFPMENPSPVLAADKHGKIIYTNLSMEMVLERYRLTMQDFLPPNHLDIVTNCLQSAYARGQVEHSARERVYSFTYNPLISHDMVQIHVLDITERKRMEEQLIHDAFHDGLTGLPNRALFLDRLTQALARARRSGNSFAVMFLDMDRFKYINDSLGHAAGDDLLIQFSQRLQLLIGPQDTLARLGGDEYTILMESVDEVTQALHMGESIQQALTEPFVVQGHEIFTSASVGIVVDNGRYTDHADMLRDADTAMYRAKAAGKARCEVFDPDMHISARARLRMETDLNKALDLDEFLVHYQPIVDLKSGELSGFEALVRWQKSDGSLVPPGAFIPLAEETGLIEHLGIRVLDMACAACASWNRELGRDFMISVNLSVRQFTSVSLLDDIRSILEGTGLVPELLKLEVTESGVMGNVEQSMALLDKLRTMGIRISIDDFGTGYSSLSYLHRFPFDFLKVDKSFVQAMNGSSDTVNRSIVGTIIALARDMGKSVIAEGIETPEQLAILRELHCAYGQGYLFARPLPHDQATNLIRSRPAWLEG